MSILQSAVEMTSATSEKFTDKKEVSSHVLKRSSAHSGEALNMYS